MRELTSLALVRLGYFRFFHGGGLGGAILLLLMGLVIVGVVVWALSRSGGADSARDKA